ncbi:TonB-linked outer membrane protein, SusC/RagA family [Sphingobacterium nematocida]|uniref:TonB-linked outer membrane protein, SusC/RagA family n=1 Tax=Sphingobacterium nematocida TaxID=1513896 RepID=A0A1T5GE42_9SPHI|nr:SusC/RagA family TonB-linked outer membrane protein [Sphingobacterium nematocida]SKC06632.1 TonB-linked outer membrane protein, SusC/RagA family [Sphingobacterium nematocida]
MKLNIITFLVAFVFQLNASTFAQKVTLEKQNSSLREIFKEIRKQTNIDFFFSDKIIDDSKKYSIRCENTPLKLVLENISKQTDLQFTLENEAIKVTSPTVTGSLVQTHISGYVFDSKGNPISGANIRVKNTPFNTHSDANGKFSVPIRDDYKTVIITHINYASIELPISKKLANVILQDRENELEEVILNVGYGQTKQSDLTGSVVQLNAKELEGFAPHQDIASMIQGKAAGVNVQISSGAPGAGVSVNIRGTTSLTGNSQPLWVIDGIPQYNVNGNDIGDILYDLNVGDVETIDILKDASATAIYGSRAANGVIIVTTKKGNRIQTPQLDASFNYGFQKQRDSFRTLKTEEFKRVITDAARNYYYTTGTIPTTGSISTILDASQAKTGTEVDYLSAPFLSNAFLDGNTNWWDEMTRTSNEKKLDVSLRGSTPTNNYFIAFGMPMQQGIIKGSDRNGFTGRINFDAKIMDKLTVGLNFNGSLNKQNNQDGMLEKIWNFRPDFPMYDENGKIFIPGYYEENPLTTLANRNYNERKGLNGNTYLQYNFSPNLFVKSSIAISYSQSFSDRFQTEGTVNSTHKGQANISQMEMANWIFENIASYNKKFGTLHDLSAMIGFSMENGATKNFAAGAQNFPDQYIMTNLTSGATAMKPTSSHTSTAMVSGFSRLNYKFDDKYILTGTFRTDGSSRFGPDKRWAYFPSGGIAWMLNKEKFMRFLDPELFNQLKIRSSLGVSGSQVLGNNDWRSLYQAAQFDESPGYAPFQLGNNNLRWEKTKTWEIGLDFALLHNRINGSIGYYDKQTSDVIYNKNIPSSSSFISVKENIANIQNSGLEFGIQGDVIRKRDMVWSLNFNIAGNKAIVKKINGVDKFMDLYAANALAIRMEEGMPLGSWYGFKWSGQYYQSMEEYNLLSKQNPTTGAKIFYQNNTNTVRPGDLRFEDINNDGLVNNDDKTFLGNSQPKFFGGFGTSFRKGNLSLNVNFVYSYGATRYWYTNSANWYTTGLFLKNYPDYVLDSWTTENRAAQWPRMSFGQGSSNTFSDFWISKADYLKVSLIRLNYRVPNELSKRVFGGYIDLSVSGTNLFTITNYNGIDPEGNFRLTGGATGMGTDWGVYPSMRSYNFSIRYSLK